MLLVPRYPRIHGKPHRLSLADKQAYSIAIQSKLGKTSRQVQNKNLKTAFLVAAISGHSEVTFPRSRGLRDVVFSLRERPPSVWFPNGFPTPKLKLSLLRPPEVSVQLPRLLMNACLDLLGSVTWAHLSDRCAICSVLVERRGRRDGWRVHCKPCSLGLRCCTQRVGLDHDQCSGVSRIIVSFRRLSPLLGVRSGLHANM